MMLNFLDAQDIPTTEKHLAQNINGAKAEQPSLWDEPGVPPTRSWSWAGSALLHPLSPKVVHKGVFTKLYDSAAEARVSIGLSPH